jgi:hypothetical protein
LGPFPFAFNPLSVSVCGNFSFAPGFGSDFPQGGSGLGIQVGQMVDVGSSEASTALPAVAFGHEDLVVEHFGLRVEAALEPSQGSPVFSGCGQDGFDPLVL